MRSLVLARRGVPRLWPATSGLVVTWVVVATLDSEPPIPLDPEHRVMGDFATWHRETWGEHLLAVNHPWFYFLGGYERSDDTRFRRITRESLGKLPAGSLIMWESHYGHRLGGDVRPEFFERARHRYRLLRDEVVNASFFYQIYEVIG